MAGQLCDAHIEAAGFSAGRRTQENYRSRATHALSIGADVTTLVVIGSVVLIINTADKIPEAVDGFLRAWIPAIRTLHDLLREIRPRRSAQQMPRKSRVKNTAKTGIPPRPPVHGPHSARCDPRHHSARPCGRCAPRGTRKAPP